MPHRACTPTGRRIRVCLLLLASGLLSAVLLLAACGDDGDTAGRPAISTPTATATVTPGPSPTPLPGRTGIPEVDAFIDAIELGNPAGARIALAALVTFSEVPCVSEPQGIGGPPACEGDETEGQPVAVFPFSACELQYLRVDRIGLLLETLLQSRLYAVYRAPPGARFDAEHVAVVTQPEPQLGDVASEVMFARRGIVGFVFSCATGPDELVELRGLTDVILPPATP